MVYYNIQYKLSMSYLDLIIYCRNIAVHVHVQLYKLKLETLIN